MPQETAAPLLALSGVRKRFPDGTDALDGVDLRVAPGEFVGPQRLQRGRGAGPHR